MLLQFNFERKICLLAIFVYWQYLPSGNICLLAIFVEWKYLFIGNICILAIFTFWQYLSSGNICYWQHMPMGKNWPTNWQYLPFKLMLSCQLEANFDRQLLKKENVIFCCCEAFGLGWLFLLGRLKWAIPNVIIKLQPSQSSSLIFVKLEYSCLSWFETLSVS